MERIDLRDLSRDELAHLAANAKRQADVLRRYLTGGRPAEAQDVGTWVLYRDSPEEPWQGPGMLDGVALHCTLPYNIYKGTHVMAYCYAQTIEPKVAAMMDTQWPDEVEEVAAPAKEDPRIGRVATSDDIGKPVFVRDTDDENWRGPYELLSRNDQLIPACYVGNGPFTAGFLQARIALLGDRM